MMCTTSHVHYISITKLSYDLLSQPTEGLLVVGEFVALVTRFPVHVQRLMSEASSGLALPEGQAVHELPAGMK